MRGFLKKYAVVASLVFVLASAVVAVVLTTVSVPEQSKVSFTRFLDMVKEKKVMKVDIDLNKGTFKFYDNRGALYITDNPKEDNFKRFLLDNGITVKERNGGQFSPVFMVILISQLILVGLIIQMRRGTGGLSPNSLSNKTIEETTSIPDTRIANIAGNEEIRDEIETLVEFLKNPQHYQSMGAKLPKGIILYGPPGTGKTLTAKAIAGEAGVPFFFMSGSDFVEIYVGMGSRKVRELFRKAKEKAPCIIFIDEIDAVGAKRSGQNNSEHNQTVNALLNELDGFDGSEGIVVIAATNRLDDLDPALIRPGRFDKHLMVNLPDQKARLHILKMYAKNKKLAEDVDLERLASLTIGFSGDRFRSVAQ